MAVTIKEGSRHCFVTKYTGNGGGQRVGNFVPYTDNGTIAKSCMFDDGSSNYLTRTQGSGSGDQKRKATFSWWFKRGSGGFGAEICMFGAASGTKLMARFDTSNRITLRLSNGGSEYQKITNRSFEDTSKWYHCVWQIDASQSTATDRSILYVDGDRITSWSSDNNPGQNTDVVGLADGSTFRIGSNSHAVGQIWDGYIAEFNYVDGSVVAPSVFGLTDTSTGRWIPKALSSITYGDEGLRLTFANSAGQTIGDDTSGNGNDLTVTNMAADHVTTDSPTQNFATFDINDQGNNAGATAGTAVLAEGNLRITAGSNPSNWDQYRTSKPLTSGKWYAEVTLTSLNTASYFGVISKNQNIKGGGWYSDQKTGWSYDTQNGKTENSNDGYVSYGSARSQGDVVGIAVDLDNGKLWFSENGTYPNSGNPATGANPAYSNLIFAIQDGGLCFTEARGYSGHNDWNFGQKSYAHTPPTGFNTVQQDNYPTSIDGGEVSETLLNRSLTIPDLMIVKNRDAADRWLWQDSTRGLGEYGSSASGAPGSPVQFNSTVTDAIKKRLVGGFQTEDSDYSNSIAEKYVSYNWSANNGVTATDTSGDLSTELQANPTAGFSIAKYTVSGSSNKTWAHGLGAVPHFGVLFTYSATTYGTVYHHQWSTSPFSNYSLLTSSGAVQTSSNIWGSAKPTSTLWTGLVGSLFSAGQTYMFYSWTGIPGYSHFGSYTGNGSAAAGPFVYTGFKPKLIWIKSAGAYSNYVFNTETHPNNPGGENVVFDGNYSEASTGNEGIEILSNGFKIRTSSVGTNQDGVHNVFGAWAEHPFAGTSLVNPTTAR